MNVETYETNETTSDGATDALDAEAVALIERMGLSGQQSLVSKGSDGDVAVMPYQEMTAQELAVYSLIFPTHDKLDAYAAGPIPLRVLQVASLASERRWFGRLEVWHKRSGSAKEDPLLVGVITDRNHDWIARQTFLLARWGDALKPFADLLQEAALEARARLRSIVAKARMEIDGAGVQIDTVSDTSAIAWAVQRGPQVHSCNPPTEG